MSIAFHPLELGKTDVLIETGTYDGSFAEKFSASYVELHTIEIVEKFYNEAKERLGPIPNVFQHFGNSPEVLKMLLKSINEPVTFWLDAHYQGGEQDQNTMIPIMDELSVIAEHDVKDHIIMIDDVRLFEVNYGTTIGEVVQALFAINPKYTIRLMPGATLTDVLTASMK